jgi:hypothetical protein
MQSGDNYSDTNKQTYLHQSWSPVKGKTGNTVKKEDDMGMKIRRKYAESSLAEYFPHVNHL